MCVCVREREINLGSLTVAGSSICFNDDPTFFHLRRKI